MDMYCEWVAAIKQSFHWTFKLDIVLYIPIAHVVFAHRIDASEGDGDGESTNLKSSSETHGVLVTLIVCVTVWQLEWGTGNQILPVFKENLPLPPGDY